MAIGLSSVPLLSDGQNETAEQKAQRLDGNVKRLIGLAVAKSIDRNLESEDAAVDADYKQNARGLAAQAGDTAEPSAEAEDMGNTVAGDHYENVTINMNQPAQPEQAATVTPLATPAATQAAQPTSMPGWLKTAITVGGISLAGLAGYKLGSPAPKFTDTDTNTGVKVTGGIPVNPTK